MIKYARFATLVFIILAAQTIFYNSYQKERVIQSNSELKELAQTIEEQPDIIYMGDSVLLRTGEEENQTPLKDLVVEHLKPCETRVVSHPAYHSTVYRAYIEYIAGQPDRSQMVIIPINLRAFSPSWAERPEWQFDELLIVGREGRNPLFHFWLALKASSNLSPAEYSSLPVYYQNQKFAVIGDFPILTEYDMPPEEIAPFNAGQMKMDYMYSIDPSQDRIIDLVRLVEVSKENNIPIQLYYTPIDFERGVSLNGEEFRRQVEHNIEEINNLLLPYDVEPLNLAFDLPFEEFSSEVYINEHLFFEGRDYVSSQLKQAIKGKVNCLDS